MTPATANPAASRGTTWSWRASLGTRKEGNSVVISSVATVSSGRAGSARRELERPEHRE